MAIIDYKNPFSWLIVFLISFDTIPIATCFQIPIKEWTRSVKTGYSQRIAADPSFAKKSITEVILAAGTQLTAEWNRRGALRLASEADFVVAGVLTAVAGKYYSMWYVAKTVTTAATFSDDSTTVTTNDLYHQEEGKEDRTINIVTKEKERRLGSMMVPSNAFQPYMLDGITHPQLIQRLGALIAPMKSLFSAGIVASAIGYGFTAMMIHARSFLVPQYSAATKNVNIIYACLYTGAFMSIFSNLRYQILQGIIEPKIDTIFKRTPILRAAFIFCIRYANGLLGSILAIAGMKMLGLQQLK